MEQFPKLSNREWEVMQHLLQGKSNKLIASSLGISVRMVEFHLKNIYAKFQISSRIELILKLGNARGGHEIEKLGRSTVAGRGEVAENRDRLNSQMGWATSFRETVSIIGKESEMKNLLNSKHILVGISTTLFIGFVWIFILLYTHWSDPASVETCGLSV
jgi:DNA-binding CsgD family transcriptional regulator